MIADPLISCLSEKGTGSWGALKSRMEDLWPDAEPEEMKGHRLRLRYALVESGVADLFLEKNGKRTDAWRICPTRLIATNRRIERVLLVGARDRELLDRMRLIAQKHQGELLGKCYDNLITVWELKGNTETLHAIAVDLSLAPILPGPDCWLNDTVPLRTLLQKSACCVEEMLKRHGWKLRQFAWENKKWEILSSWEQRLTEEGTVIEQSNGYSERDRAVYYRDRWIPLPYHESLHIGAMIAKQSPYRYDVDRQALGIPTGMPLPDAMARAAIGCAGRAPRVEGEYKVYESVDPQIAAIILCLLGSNHPDPDRP